MQIGTILVVLSLSMLLATFILRPFLSSDNDLESAINDQVEKYREKDKDILKPIFCTQCGHQLEFDARFCSQCGHSVEGGK